MGQQLRRNVSYGHSVRIVKHVHDDRFSIFMGQQRWVVLNSFAAAQEVLDKRGRIYISRPYFPVTQDILSGGNRVVLMQHGERWRTLRKVMHQLLTAKQVGSDHPAQRIRFLDTELQADTYKPYQDTESRKLLWDFLQEPQDFHMHGARFANSGMQNFMATLRVSR